MENKKKIFLAANSPNGFVSFFGELYNPYKSCRAYIIKGGPGTGKSSFMKKIAAAGEERDLEVVRVYCSSDPESLDAVMIPQLEFCVADGTAPHVLEPRFPGAVENILNLGEFWNERELFEKRDEIRALSLENSIYHRRASHYLASAAPLIKEKEKLVSPLVLEAKLSGFATRFCSRETPKKKNASPGQKKVCFLSGITPKGSVFFGETLCAYAGRIIAIEDEHGVAAGMLLEQIGETAAKSGWDVIFCRCPLRPDGYCEHLIIPEASLALATKKSAHGELPFVSRTIHARRFMQEDAALFKNRLLLCQTLTERLTSSAVELLSQAKAVHDKLERIYMESMDFKKLNEFSEKFIFSLFAE